MLNLGHAQQLLRTALCMSDILRCVGHGAVCQAQSTAHARSRRTLDSLAALILSVPKVWARKWLALEWSKKSPVLATQARFHDKGVTFPGSASHCALKSAIACSLEKIGRVKWPFSFDTVRVRRNSHAIHKSAVISIERSVACKPRHGVTAKRVWNWPSGSKIVA